MWLDLQEHYIMRYDKFMKHNIDYRKCDKGMKRAVITAYYKESFILYTVLEYVMTFNNGTGKTTNQISIFILVTFDKIVLITLNDLLM